MKLCTLILEGKTVRVFTEDAEYAWPLDGPEGRFTYYLLRKLLTPHEVLRLLYGERLVAVYLPKGTLDIYLPPAYRPLSTKISLWNRFTNLFKKENHHARNQHPERIE